MQIDWDEVLGDADNTPRSVIAEVLGMADEIKNLKVIIQDHDGIQREWTYCESVAMEIAMLQVALYSATKAVHEASEL